LRSFSAQGKFTELQFDPTGTLAGARVREYLLEKAYLKAHPNALVS